MAPTHPLPPLLRLRGMAGARAVGSATEGGQHMLRSCSFFALAALGALCAPVQPSHAQVLTVEEQQQADTYFNECAKDWDASTHMTKVEWERTCRRVATDRVRFKIQQPHDAKQN